MFYKPLSHHFHTTYSVKYHNLLYQYINMNISHQINKMKFNRYIILHDGGNTNCIVWLTRFNITILPFHMCGGTVWKTDLHSFMYPKSSWCKYILKPANKKACYHRSIGESYFKMLLVSYLWATDRIPLIPDFPFTICHAVPYPVAWTKCYHIQHSRHDKNPIPVDICLDKYSIFTNRD